MPQTNWWSADTPSSGGTAADIALRNKGKSYAQAIMNQALGNEPVYTRAQGMAKVGMGALGGVLDGLDARKETQGRQDLANAIMGLQGPAAAGGLSGAPTGGPAGAGGAAKRPMSLTGDMGQYAKAIQGNESGGRYDAIGPQTKSGDHAYGAYQVMGANIPEWTKAALGRSMTPAEFVADPNAQDAVFAHRFGSYVDKYGNPQDAASAWFTGRPLAQGGNARDVLGTTGNVYVDKFNRTLASLGGQPAGSTQVAGATAPSPQPQPQPQPQPAGPDAPAPVQSPPPGVAQVTDNRPAWAYPVGNEPGAFQPAPTAQADLPAPGARPVSYDAMGNFTPDQNGPGFFIPPGSAPTPAIGTGGLTMQADPPQAAPGDPAALGTSPADLSALFSGAPLGPAQSFQPAASPGGDPQLALRGTIPPDGGQGSPIATAALDPNAGAPLPPPRPDQSTLVAAAPLPPSRPGDLPASPADLPAPGARQAMLIQPPNASLVDPNSNDGGAGAFARAGMGAPQSRTAMLADAISGGPQTTGSIPRGVVIPPGASGGPPPGPNGPVASPDGGAAPSLGQRFAEAIGLGGSAPAAASAGPGAPIDKRALLAQIISSPYASPAMVEYAMKQANPEWQKLNDGTLYDPRSGRFMSAPTQPYTLSEGQARFGNDNRQVAGVAKAPEFKETGKNAYGDTTYGFVSPQTQTVTPYAAPGGAGAVVRPGQPGSTIPAPPAGVDPKTWSETQSKSAATNAVPADNQAVSEMRKEVISLPSYKNYKQAAPVYRAMVDTAGTNSKASDLNMIYGLGKIMDPGSVVREGEMVMANNTAGIQERLNGMINSINGGATLTPETRKALMDEAYGRMKSYESEYNVDAGHYRGVAGRNRMNADDVVPSFEPMKPWAPAAKTGDGGTGTPPPKMSAADTAQSIANARAAIGRGAPRDAVAQQLRAAGVDPSGL